MRDGPQAPILLLQSKARLGADLFPALAGECAMSDLVVDQIDRGAGAAPELAQPGVSRIRCRRLKVGIHRAVGASKDPSTVVRTGETNRMLGQALWLGKL